MRAGIIAVAFFIPCVAGASALFSQMSDLSGVAEGEASHFQITDSDYLNISLESTEIIKLKLESVPKVITMRIKSVSAEATSTQITITGLMPDTLYYRYEDNLHNLTEGLSDGSGAYSYVQDLSKPHLVFIQPRKSTKFIQNDATGGDCASMGIWDSATLTCTLMADIAETIQIDSDGVTLDGGGHTTDGASGAVNGVFLDTKTGVTIKNLVIKDFSYGVFFNASSNSVISSSTVSGAREAISLESSLSNTIKNNDLRNNRYAISLSNSNDNSVRNNNISIDISSSRRHQAVVLFGSSDNLLEGNSITMNNDMDPGIHQGVLLFDSFRNTIRNNNLSKIYQALLLFDSNGNKVYNNNFSSNGTPAMVFGDMANMFSSEPGGGNYWDNFDESAEGCEDADADTVCDAAYSFTGGQDTAAWVINDGWNIPLGPKVSNVLFLPGIEGSRLYEGNGCGKATEEKLWEPFESVWKAVRGVGDKKVGDLSLDSTGASMCADIYAKEGDVIEAVNGNKIYASLVSEMNGLKSDGTINDWKPVAYDWRLSLDDLLSKGTQRGEKIFYEEATSTPYIEQTLRALAASSKTKKVIIIAHSNGGLVTKALLNKLGGETAKSLVDKIILVGVPQSGAPADIGATLVGHDAGIYGKYGVWVVSNAAARTLVQNSPMAYHLLPSEDYLKSTAGDAAHPVIRFSGKAYAKEAAAYGSTIANKSTLDDFLLAKEGDRKKPKPSDLNSAEILNPALIDYANSTHAVLDAWMPPPGVEVNQIAGWGVDTIQGIDFYTASTTITTFFNSKRRYKPIFIEDGDGTVPVPSALMVASSTEVKRYWVNLDKFNREQLSSRRHKDIFEIPSLKEFIKNIITNSTSTLPVYISSSQPPSAVENKKLIFFLHSSPASQASTTSEREDSPVRVTLQVKRPSGEITGIAEDDSITEDVLGSTYGEFGEVRYIIVPESGPYELMLRGQANSGWASGGQGGTFALSIQESSGDIVTTTTTIADIPLTASTTASLTISGSIDTTSALTVDENGNGENIITITPKVGETVNYELPQQPSPEPPVPEIPPARAAGGPGYSPYIPPAVSTPLVLGVSTTTHLSAAATTTVFITSTPRHSVATRRTPKRPTASTPSATTVHTFPNLSQTASVYGVSQQSALKKMGKTVYNSLHSLLRTLKSLF
jgi:parallel beta-helix repeat protein